MKQNFLLIYAIVLFVISSAVLYLGADSGLLVDTINLCIIGGMTLLGYVGSFLAYLGYREQLKESQ
jgi:hypothetical protein